LTERLSRVDKLDIAVSLEPQDDRQNRIPGIYAFSVKRFLPQYLLTYKSYIKFDITKNIVKALLKRTRLKVFASKSPYLLIPKTFVFLPLWRFDEIFTIFAAIYFRSRRA
jgi:hypothetical protein